VTIIDALTTGYLNRRHRKSMMESVFLMPGGQPLPTISRDPYFLPRLHFLSQGRSELAIHCALNCSSGSTAIS